MRCSKSLVFLVAMWPEFCDSIGVVVGGVLGHGDNRGTSSMGVSEFNQNSVIENVGCSRSVKEEKVEALVSTLPPAVLIRFCDYVLFQ